MKVVDQGFQCDTGNCVNVAICLEVQIHATPYLCAVILLMFFFIAFLFIFLSRNT